MANETKEQLKRAPVAVIVGHVDHGKTSLLDYIRKTNIVGREAGGITQSVGAYEIEHDGKKITFIDTPGHEAFSKMRERGAHVADVAILVVAADEGVKPQTKEALKAIIGSKTPFVVALTKIDKSGIDIDKTKNDLMTNGVFLEGYGGDVSYQGVSSKTGEGIGELLDLIVLASEVEDLSYDPEALASGMILETKLDKRRGNTVTVILKNGTLRRGDMIMTPSAKGKVKILENFLGKAVDELLPSSPAVIMGFEELPAVGEEFKAGKLSEKELDEVVKKASTRVTGSGAKDEQTVRVILKADTAGSLEALNDLLRKIPIAKNQRLEIISQTVGEITDGDVKDALATGAFIIGFGSYPTRAAENLARVHDIMLLTDEIIYKLVEQIETMFKTMHEGNYQGELQILATFSAKNRVQTIGGKVTKGRILTKAWLDIRRDDAIIGKGKVVNLQQAKKDANVVSEGNECGLLFESDIIIQTGDILLQP
ncbi:GTP-binding protein [Patescibacteria group bacterium]|nr:GTP-binding protein [Patescibacteria group bacterium]